MNRLIVYLLPILLVLALPSRAIGQVDSLTAPYPPERCSDCAAWNAPHAPVRIHANTYYVGTEGLASILITAPGGHVLIDGGLPDSAPRILENIRSLGFAPRDVRLILNSHAHYDHAGGIAALQRATGAPVAASASSAAMLEAGRPAPDDPQYAIALPYPPVAGVERVDYGDTVRVGGIALIPHRTAGHTRGGTTWSWQSCAGGDCLQLVYADSQTPVSADGFRFSDSASYPEAVADFREAHDILRALPCDLLLTPHPGASEMWQRVDAGTLIDAEACRRYAERSKQQLERRLEREREER